MSVLGIHKVLELIKKDKLIEHLGPRDLNNPEGVGVDLRMGEAHKIIEGGAFIEADGTAGLGRRKGVKTEMIGRFYEDSETQAEIEIKPGEYLLISTVEQINTPKNLMPMVYSRSSLFRAGLLLLVTKVDPGYRGPLTMGLRNLSEFPVKLQMGARVCNIVFHQIEGEGVEYRGQHQGGRISPSEVEQQV
jgi:deoxycytidine triphosphate deaminase